jgi:hypothetical protein
MSDETGSVRTLIIGAVVGCLLGLVAFGVWVLWYRDDGSLVRCSPGRRQTVSASPHSRPFPTQQEVLLALYGNRTSLRDLPRDAFLIRDADPQVGASLESTEGSSSEFALWNGGEIAASVVIHESGDGYRVERYSTCA